MSKLPNNILSRLSEKTGISVTKLSDYAATRTRPSRKRFPKLEKASGVDAVVWLFGTSDEIKSALIGDEAA